MRRFSFAFFGILLAVLAAGGAYGLRHDGDYSSLGLGFLNSLWPGRAASPRVYPRLPVRPAGQEESSIEASLAAQEGELNYGQRMEKGDYFFTKGFFAFAGSEYAQASRLDPQNPDPYLKLLKTDMELGNHEKALASANSLLALSPEHAEGRFLQALAHLRLSDFDGAQTLLAQLPSDPPQAQATYYKGMLASLRGEHEEAKKLLEQAKAQTQEAELIGKANRVLEAYQEYEFAQSAKESYRLSLLAKAYNQNKDYELTLHSMKALLQAEPDLRDSWILLGFAQLNLDQSPSALEAFQKAYSLDSEWAPTQYFLGLTQKELGNTAEAIRSLSMAAENRFEPELVVRQNLADLYFEAKQYQESVAAYERVIELSGQDLETFIRPVWIYLDFLGQPQKALGLAELAVASFPQEALSYNLLGWSQIGMKNYPQAEGNLKKSLSLDPSLTAAQYNLGLLYQAQQKNDLALDAYKKAYQMDQSGPMGNKAARAYNALMEEAESGES